MFHRRRINERQPLDVPRTMQRLACLIGASMVVLLSAVDLSASYAIYIGKNCTADGCVYLAGYGDEPSSHWLEIVPRQTHPNGATISVGANEKARYPGRLITLPQVKETARYITMNYSAFAGFPAPLTNGGLNEHGVAARDVWSPSREELRKLTPNPQQGPSYSDLSRIVMQRAKTAREAVEIVGRLINKYGYTTYGGNSHLFADANEGWILINFAGGRKLWVAQRLGPDDIRVSRPGYIGDVPLDFAKHPDYMGSPNLISFAVEQGWYDPKSGKPFNVNAVYGDGKLRHPAVKMIEEHFAKRKGKITLPQVMAAVRHPQLTRDSAGYGQVAPLKQGTPADLRLLWIAPASPLTAPFVPWRIGVTSVPAEFRRHRYLTEGEASKFIDRRQRGVESTRSAFRSCKRLFYLTQEHRETYLPEVTAALVGAEKRLIAEQPTVEATAAALLAAGKPHLARTYLTYYSRTEALKALGLCEALATGIEARTKAGPGIRRPE